jgi:hypothetical protein
MEGQSIHLEWVQLRAHPNYDIQLSHPFLIRKRSNGRIIALTPSHNYITCRIDGKLTPHHRVIAEQFLANPDNLPQIDHINHIRSDNRLDNIRWVSPAENIRNKTSYMGHDIEYLDTLPDGAEPIATVRGRKIAMGHYRRGNDFFVEVAGRFRRLTISRNAGGAEFVRVRGATGDRISVTIGH